MKTTKKKGKSFKDYISVDGRDNNNNNNKEKKKENIIKNNDSQFREIFLIEYRGGSAESNFNHCSTWFPGYNNDSDNILVPGILERPPSGNDQGFKFFVCVYVCCFDSLACFF